MDTIRLLLAYGADPNAASETGFTPLHGAVMSRKVANVSALLDAGASPKAEAPNVGTALDLARKLPEDEILILLLARSPD